MTLVDHGRLIREYEETIHDGMRLGRHMILDRRSLDHMVEDTAAVRLPIRPVAHDPVIPVLNQGRLGSCSGHAGTNALSSLYDAPNVDGEPLDEAFAIELYSEATREDGFRGVYPPDDTGSSGLGVCRALHHDRLISGYRWARSVHGIAQLLQTDGVMVGSPWFESWFEPDKNGFIDYRDNNSEDPGPLAGGHEYYISELESWDDRQPENSVIVGWNSWGPRWGDHGRFRMRLRTYLKYQPDIDVKQLSR